ncbi:MAG: hypothetical protein OWS03_06135 [Alicyclobacillaceae bacterium]|nr:hypothetical protein [Alicyclobacillaceae bacterium]
MRSSSSTVAVDALAKRGWGVSNPTRPMLLRAHRTEQEKTTAMEKVVASIHGFANRSRYRWMRIETKGRERIRRRSAKMNTNERERRTEYLDRMRVYRLVQAVMRTMREDKEKAAARARWQAWCAECPPSSPRQRMVYTFERGPRDGVSVSSDVSIPRSANRERLG